MFCSPPDSILSTSSWSRPAPHRLTLFLLSTGLERPHSRDVNFHFTSISHVSCTSLPRLCPRPRPLGSSNSAPNPASRLVSGRCSPRTVHLGNHHLLFGQIPRLDQIATYHLELLLTCLRLVKEVSLVPDEEGAVEIAQLFGWQNWNVTITSRGEI